MSAYPRLRTYRCAAANARNGPKSAMRRSSSLHHSPCHLARAIDESFTTGVRVRFFSVMIPTGQGSIGRSTGKTLSGGRLAPNCNREAGIAPKKGPLGRKAQMKEAPPTPRLWEETLRRNSGTRRRGAHQPLHSAAAGPKAHHANSDSSILRRRAHLLFRAGDDQDAFVKQRFPRGCPLRSCVIRPR